MNTETNPKPASPQSIDVSAIERELNALWKDAGKEDEHGGVTRSSVLNLLVYINGQNSSSEVDEILTEVTAAHPSRAILIAADRQATDSGLQANVISRCSLQGAATRQVCCEQVTILARGEQVNEVHSAVIPLLLSDLPVYLWWRAVPPLADKVFNRLAEISNRVIIDSAIFADQHGDLISLSLLLRDRPKWTAISDLNWARLTAWRQLIAGFYDNAEYRPALNLVNKFVIEFAPSTDQPDKLPPRALLVAGWMAARLGWRLDKVVRSGQDGSITFEFLSKTHRVFVEFRATAPAVSGPGHLTQITLKTDSFAEESRDIRFVIKTTDEGRRLQTSILLGDEIRPGRLLGYQQLTESELVGRELEILTRDRVYEQSVLMAGEMLVTLTQTQEEKWNGE
jgi:glucose-6-phosphate dehydrogenase assembly protein OpcA